MQQDATLFDIFVKFINKVIQLLSIITVFMNEWPSSGLISIITFPTSL